MRAAGYEETHPAKNQNESRGNLPVSPSNIGLEVVRRGRALDSHYMSFSIYFCLQLVPKTRNDPDSGSRKFLARFCGSRWFRGTAMHFPNPDDRAQRRAGRDSRRPTAAGCRWRAGTRLKNRNPRWDKIANRHRGNRSPVQGSRFCNSQNQKEFSPIQIRIEVDEKCVVWSFGQIGDSSLNNNSKSPNGFNIKMKIKNHEQHLEMFQRQFLDQTNHQLHLTQSNLIDALPPPQPIPPTNPTNPHVQPIMPAPPSRPGWTTIRKYRLTPHHSILQILGGYTITIGLMYLNRVVYFSFFEAIMVVIISLSTRPLEITGSFFIMLGVPISIANYNLNVYVFTYPMIVICYFSRFIFTNRQIRSLLWIVSCVLQLIFGFVLLPAIGRGLPPSLKIVLYYIYPWLLVIVRLLVGLLNEYIADTFPLLLQVSLFIQGLSYGMVLTLRIYNIEFWYLLILLTLEIINTRYQFLLGLLKKALSIKTHSVIQAHCSGHVSMNSLHIIIFIYMVSALSLTTPKFEYNMKRYIENILNPLIVWVFFVAYELLSIIRLYNNQKFMILGHAEHSYFSIFARALGLSLGLWFFYLGLGVPTLIFY